MTPVTVTPRRAARAWLAIAALALAAAACSPAAETASPAPEEPSPAAPAPASLPDGEHFGFISGLSADGSLQLDAAELLSGPEAEAAARAAGDLEGDDGLPNDFYVLNPDPATVELPVAADAEISVFDCSAGCEPKPVAFADLAGGAVRALNGERAVYKVEIADGTIVSLAEQYLP